MKRERERERERERKKGNQRERERERGERERVNGKVKKKIYHCTTVICYVKPLCITLKQFRCFPQMVSITFYQKSQGLECFSNR